MRVFFSKIGETKAGLDGNSIQEPMTETADDVWACVSTIMFTFGNDNDTISYDDEDQDMGDENFLNKSKMSVKTDFDNVIKLWMKHMSY